jgi:predicted nucleic acid-binding protein
MRFWDSSALVPLLVKHSMTRVATAAYRDDPVQGVWWGSDIECVSAIQRLERNGDFTALRGLSEAHGRLEALRSSWQQIEPSTEIKEVALRLLRVHPLRAADALQLAAAFVMSEGRPATLELVCLDDRLTNAARREGFVCIFDPAELGSH